MFAQHLELLSTGFGGSGECPAKEVMKYNEPNGYFASSPEPKHTRGNVKYRVGQIIKHKKFGYRGVIIGTSILTYPSTLFKNLL